MSIEVKIPAVGESITSGIISAWHKKDGDTVKAGDALFTLETDKVSTEVTAEKEGTLRIKAAEGAEVKIGEVVALIEDAATAKSEPAPAAAPAPKEAPAPAKKTKGAPKAAPAPEPAPESVKAAGTGHASHGR